MKPRIPHFKKIVDQILKARGLKFKGVHLRCRRCGEQAFAASLEVAISFGGWTKLRKRDRSHCIGLCIDCSGSKETKRKSKGDVL